MRVGVAMGEQARNTAWQAEQRFTVRLLAESGRSAETSGFPDLASAAEVALEWLDREDPEREGKARLVVVRVDRAGEETILRYPLSPAEPTTAPVPHRVVPTEPAPAAEPKSQPAPAHVPVRYEPVPDIAPEPEEVPPTRDWVALRRRAVGLVQASWEDRLSRVLLVVAGVCLWFSLALVEPLLFVLGLLMVSALVVRQRRMPPVEVDDDF